MASGSLVGFHVCMLLASKLTSYIDNLQDVLLQPRECTYRRVSTSAALALWNMPRPFSSPYNGNPIAPGRAEYGPISQSSREGGTPIGKEGPQESFRCRKLRYHKAQFGKWACLRTECGQHSYKGGKLTWQIWRKCRIVQMRELEQEKPQTIVLALMPHSRLG